MSKPRETKSRTVADDVESKDVVTLKLAHPLNAERARQLGLDTDGEELPVGHEVALHRNYARTLINAGYAQVDPEDREAVAKVLGTSRAKAGAGDTVNTDSNPGSGPTAPVNSGS